MDHINDRNQYLLSHRYSIHYSSPIYLYFIAAKQTSNINNYEIYAETFPHEYFCAMTKGNLKYKLIRDFY